MLGRAWEEFACGYASLQIEHGSERTFWPLLSDVAICMPIIEPPRDLRRWRESSILGEGKARDETRLRSTGRGGPLVLSQQWWWGAAGKGEGRTLQASGERCVSILGDALLHDRASLVEGSGRFVGDLSMGDGRRAVGDAKRRRRPWRRCERERERDVTRR